EIVTASQDGTARLWNIRMHTPQPLAFPLTAGGGEATLSPDGSRVIVSIRGDAIQVCDARAGKPVSPLLEHPASSEPARIGHTALSADGSRILTAGLEGLVRVWDARSYQALADLRVGNPVLEAWFCWNGQRIVTCDRLGFIKIWGTDGQLHVTCPQQSGEALGL